MKISHAFVFAAVALSLDMSSFSIAQSTSSVQLDGSCFLLGSMCELWNGFLPVADDLEVPMSIAMTDRCLEICVNATQPPVYIKSYLFHAATVISPFNYSKSMDFICVRR